MPPELPSLGPIDDLLEDAWLRAGIGWGGTAPEFFPIVRIDQVWTSETVDIRSVRVHRLDGSDHLAVVVDFIL